MQVHVKAPRIDVLISGSGARRVLALIRTAYPELDARWERVKGGISIEESAESVNVTETAWWKKMRAEWRPGDSIRIYRDNQGLTLARLSGLTGIAESHLSAMENGKRGIGRISAMKLGKALSCDYRRFL